jgi:transposase InsO family protein
LNVQLDMQYYRRKSLSSHTEFVWMYSKICNTINTSEKKMEHQRLVWVYDLQHDCVLCTKWVQWTYWIRVLSGWTRLEKTWF